MADGDKAERRRAAKKRKQARKKAAIAAEIASERARRHAEEEPEIWSVRGHAPDDRPRTPLKSRGSLESLAQEGSSKGGKRGGSVRALPGGAPGLGRRS